jgi:hypothetical protein
MKQAQFISLEKKKDAQLKQSASMTSTERFHYMLELIQLSNLLAPNNQPKSKDYFQIFTLKRSE